MLSRRLRLWIISVGLCLVVLASLGSVVAWALASLTPQWWRTVHHDEDARQIARTVENAVVTEMNLVRPTDPAYKPSPDDPAWTSARWGVVLDAGDANAWLNNRFPQWLANQSDGFGWPEELPEVQVDFDDGQIRLGVRVEANGKSRFFWATLVPDFDADGSLWMRARWVHLGRLPVPASWVLGSARNHVDRYIPTEILGLPETHLLIDAISGMNPAAESPAVRIPDGRRVLLLSIDPYRGRLRLTCRTELD